ncbi:hypothetical protein [Amycolatopsis sulphurea]|uniref:hypothetical protein n=1 Tax=Amycolatopsis sulphurea TaxID=76022 RepID=UPI001FE77F79|nr:hypothetical protein [Amycolatopsis sulphurea]
MITVDHALCFPIPLLDLVGPIGEKGEPGPADEVTTRPVTQISGRLNFTLQGVIRITLAIVEVPGLLEMLTTDLRCLHQRPRTAVGLPRRVALPALAHLVLQPLHLTRDIVMLRRQITAGRRAVEQVAGPHPFAHQIDDLLRRQLRIHYAPSLSFATTSSAALVTTGHGAL